MNPYTVLGVTEEATAEAIRHAFKAAAKRTHPDAGGSEEAFAEVSKAFDCLSDPQRRDYYDRTGEIDESSSLEDPIEKEARTMLAKQIGIEVDSVLERKAFHVDVIEQVRRKVDYTNDRHQEQLEQEIETLAKLEDIAKRFEADPGVGNIGVGAVGSLLVGVRRAIEAHVKNIKVGARMVELLKTQRYRADPPPPPKPLQPRYNEYNTTQDPFKALFGGL